MTDCTFSPGIQAAQKLLSRFSIIRDNKVLGYGVGLVAFIAALVLRISLDAAIPRFPFITFIPAVVVSAFLAGSRAGLFCAALSFLSAWYWFVDPMEPFSVSFNAVVGLCLFVFIVAVDIAIIEVAARVVNHLIDQQADLDEGRIALNEALRVKELLLYEVNHRVKNSLHLVNSLLLLEASKIGDSEARSSVMAARNKVALVARLHQRLYSSGTHESVDLKATIEDTVRELMLTAERSDVNLEISFSGDHLISIKQARPLVLAVNEIITNSLKYGLSAKRPKLTLSALNTSDTLTLVIRDNGPGMPAPTTDEISGLGSKIIEGLVSQMRGKFVVQSDISGTAIVLTVPTNTQSSDDKV